MADFSIAIRTPLSYTHLFSKNKPLGNQIAQLYRGFKFFLRLKIMPD